VNRELPEVEQKWKPIEDPHRQASPPAEVEEPPVNELARLGMPTQANIRTESAGGAREAPGRGRGSRSGGKGRPCGSAPRVSGSARSSRLP